MNDQQGGGKPDPGAQHAGAGPAEHGQEGNGGERREVGNAVSSRRDPPHVTENDEEAPLQEESESPAPIPALPANASGRDEQPGDGTGQRIRDESMYENRPSTDKDHPPSTSGGG